MRPVLRQFGKFAVVGIISFIIDYSLMIFLAEIFGMGEILSASISFCVSVIFNYIASMKFVFSHREGMSQSYEFVIFVILSIIGLILNDLIMWVGISTFDIDYRIVKILATMMVTLYNFFSRKKFLEGGRT